MTQRDIVRLAHDLMRQHLHPLFGGTGWTFKLNTNKTQRGVCKFTKTDRRTGIQRPIKRIEVSVHLLSLPNPEQEVRNTLLHEIAHAMVGPGHNHDHVWKSAARRIGCTGDRCGADMQVRPNFIGRCSKCPVEFPRFRVKARMRRTGYHPPCGKDARIIWSAV